MPADSIRSGPVTLLLSTLLGPVSLLLSVLSGPVTLLLSMLYVLMKLFSYVSAKKITKKLRGFQTLHFYWPFGGDITAVKGLNLAVPS